MTRFEPFLAKYGRKLPIESASEHELFYDPTRMLTLKGSEPAINDPSYDERGGTLITRVERETTDDN